MHGMGQLCDAVLQILRIGHQFSQQHAGLYVSLDADVEGAGADTVTWKYSLDVCVVLSSVAFLAVQLLEPKVPTEFGARYRGLNFPFS